MGYHGLARARPSTTKQPRVQDVLIAERDANQATETSLARLCHVCKVNARTEHWTEEDVLENCCTACYLALTSARK